ncbi:hypothetical protein LOZ57_001958 [Ophidiomyces ophidiicola]|uniref:uncharacterized protein n=1 Tax=Ophidiomyces ophidiicola TaxID=1387563 RepID=UPI0020C455C2|nr:uncharacterized protein LOZ57_001958 [Ophidiomyces ophidiicola]KAI1950399.1 hypothetical protein LOZ57_001958 [Ophidiomyces ophidiicola]KAI2063085.1 hypothetical protein LOZ43_000142 [Ophidiomyces ophidiicola]
MDGWDNFSSCNPFETERCTPVPAQSPSGPNDFSCQQLHTKKIIHGDIKPPNFLHCSGDQLRLCDFSEGLRFDEDLSNWNGMTTANYISPHRTRLWPGSASEPPQTIEDDLYGLGVSIWELYTGKVPFDGWYEDGILWALQRGETVNVNEIKDEEVKAVICEYLRIGGAKV